MPSLISLHQINMLSTEVQHKLGQNQQTMLNSSSSAAPQKLLPKSGMIIICLACGFQAGSCIIKAPATGAQHRLLLISRLPIVVAFWHGPQQLNSVRHRSDCESAQTASAHHVTTPAASCPQRSTQRSMKPSLSPANRSGFAWPSTEAISGAVHRK